MTKIITWFQSRDIVAGPTEEEGQGLAEYGLILALVSVVAVAALTGLAGGIKDTLTKVTSSL